MEKAAVAFFDCVTGIGICYILAAVFVGADTLIPHKYIVYKDGKKYATNKKPE